jgi:glutamate carboxypeptidase
LRPPDWLRRFERRRDRILADLAALVRLESPSDDTQRVSAVARWIRERLRGAGVAADTFACAPRGDAVAARVGSGPGSLLVAHHDTVWPVGSWGEAPFHVEKGRASGPGVFDMKAGIAVAIAVLEALAAEPRPPAAALVSVPDEEVGSFASRAALLERARGQHRVLVLEPSLDGAVKIARKGTGTFELGFRGRAAHAGLEPEKGASALAELARCALFLETLGDAAAGTTVTPTLAAAGSRSNVVPEEARLTLDVRVWRQAEAARVEAALRAHRPADPRVALELGGGFDRPPLEPTPESTALYERARDIAAELGFELGTARVGGASDGNLTAAAGVPTLDGLGPRGDGAHARHEHVVVEDLTRRAALLAALVSAPA